MIRGCRIDENNERSMLFFGLSANPVHQSHVDLVVDAVKALVGRAYQIARVLITPVYRRNLAGEHKEHLPQTFEERFMLCTLAAKEMEQRLAILGTRVQVSRMEEQLARSRETPNATLETLSLLRIAEPDTGLISLLSSDLVSGEAPELGRWHRPDKLVQLATLAICPRFGYQRNERFLNSFGQAARLVYLDEVVVRDMAASSIKARLEAGESPLALSKEGLLPLSVAMYIAKHGM